MSLIIDDSMKPSSLIFNKQCSFCNILKILNYTQLIKIVLHDNNRLGKIVNGPNISWLRNVHNNNLINCYFNEAMLGEIIAPISIAWLIEPRSIIPHVYASIPQIQYKFQYIFTYDDILLQRDNTKFKLHPAAGIWTQPLDIPPLKNKKCSFICSSKTMCPMHRFRHEVVKKFEHFVDIYGYYSWVEEKNIGLSDYMFSIAIENSIEDYYFTEKIMDCFVTYTIPIYCGAKKLEHFFDMQGVIVWNEFVKNGQIKMLSKELYENHLPSVIKNRELANKWISSHQVFDWKYLDLLQQIAPA